MKILNSKKTFKIICLVLVVITITNIFAPICSYAAKDNTDDADSDFGGKLFKPIAKLVRAMADGIIMGLQYMFLGYGNIKKTTTVDSEGAVTEVEALSGKGNDKSKDYSILYGPATIFSNKVPALNANFINPSDTKFKIDETETATKAELKGLIIGGGSYSTDAEKDNESTYNDEALKQTGAKTSYGFQEGKGTSISKTSSDAGADLFNIVNSDKVDAIYVEKWSNEGTTYYLVRAVFEETKTVTYFLYTNEVTETRNNRRKTICSFSITKSSIKMV